MKRQQSILGIGSVHRTTVEKLVYGGEGLCRVQGKVIFIPFCLPEEEIEFEVIREKKDVAFGRLVRVITPSSERISPRCSVFGVCGGCHLQHLSIESQGSLKSSWVKESLGKFFNEKTIWQEPLPSTNPWHYRRRIRMHQSSEGGWGFYRRREHQVVEISTCPIAHPAFFSDPTVLKECEGEVDLVYDSHSKKVHRAALHSEVLTEGFDGYEVEVDVGDFLQVNAEENQSLVSFVSELAQKGGTNILWDLFAGSGNFSIPLASTFKQVVCLEGSERAVERLKKNALKNALTNVEAIGGWIDGRGLFDLIKKSIPDLIILDPPRGGARQVVEAIAKLKPETNIVYISCDLPSLRRDITVLNQAGFDISNVRWFDFFPQTFHLETVVLLQPGRALSSRSS